MSLDVYLRIPENEIEYCECSYCDGKGRVPKNGTSFYHRNITHNLNKMASEAGIYSALWHPEEIGAKQAKDIIATLEIGLKRLKENPEFFKKFDAKNGWGRYEHLVEFVRDYLAACKKNPDAEIEVSV